MRTVWDLFSEWGTGRLAPRRFAMLYALLLLNVVVLLIVVGVGALMTIELVDAAGDLRGKTRFGIALVIAIFLLLAALFNIVVKRGRDIGIPGFLTGIGFIMLFMMGGLSAFLAILLALVPTGTFASRQT